MFSADCLTMHESHQINFNLTFVIEQKNNTPLICATKQNCIDIVSYLLTKNVNINTQSRDVFCLTNISKLNNSN